MKSFITFLSIISIASFITAKPITTLPHPVFTTPERITLSVTVSAYPDSVVPPAAVESLMYTSLKTEMTTRFSRPATTPVIITTPEHPDTSTATISISVLGYSVTPDKCSLYVDYRITDDVSTFSDTAITTYTIDTKKLRGTYKEKKTAACAQAIRLFILDFLTTFWPLSDR